MKGHFFEKGETNVIKSNVVFQFEKWLFEKKGNNRIYMSYFKNREGEVVAKEKLVLKGQDPIRYELDQFQVDERAVFILKEDRSLKMLYKEGKQSDVRYLKWEKNYILPPMIPEYIKTHFPSLRSKGSKEVELVVPHLQTNFSFTFYLNEKKIPQCLEKAFICILFKPSNFFIGLFTDPLFLSFDKKFRLIKASGPTLLYWRKSKKEALSPFSGDSYFNLKGLSKKMAY